MKLKKIEVTNENEEYVFFTIKAKYHHFFEHYKKKHKCFYDKNKMISRFFDTGKLIETDLNHSIKAWMSLRK